MEQPLSLLPVCTPWNGQTKEGEKRRKETGEYSSMCVICRNNKRFSRDDRQGDFVSPPHSLAPTSCSFMWKFALNVLNEQHKCGSCRTCWLNGWWRQCNVLCLLLFLVRYLFIHLLFTYYTSYRRPSHTQCAMLALPLPACLLLPGCPRVPIHIDMSY